jgi:protein-tyrosine phosphatase
VRTDVHFHLLPGVDDGPATVEDSVALARRAVVDGTATVVATPHARLVEVHAVCDYVRTLRARLAAERVPLRVLPGLEIAQDDVARLSDRELDAVAQGPPGRRWLLLEAPVSADPSPLPGAAGELMARGYGVLVGHPERCRGLMTAAGMLDELLIAGARLQLNGSSLIGRHGDDARSWALELALSGRAEVVASDAHGAARGPVLSASVATLSRAGMATAAAEGLVSSRPRDLLRRGFQPTSVRPRSACAARR